MDPAFYFDVAPLVNVRANFVRSFSQEASRVPACLDVVKLLLADDRLLPDYATTPCDASSNPASAAIAASVTGATPSTNMPKSTPEANSTAAAAEAVVPPAKSQAKSAASTVAGRRRRSGTVDEEHYIRAHAPRPASTSSDEGDDDDDDDDRDEDEEKGQENGAESSGKRSAPSAATSSHPATAETPATKESPSEEIMTPLLVACQEGAAGAVALLLRDGKYASKIMYKR